ncbi:hypothetical protein M9H77_03900 [Catharanthus roseus]|uniref:Uncharacterized protein n=1 Tax=Catharanthus roseus TaxID=4058 RepID=A0ACC0CCI6_CATRO|nr:hypothetical protein M9H77_03900 [Catharanthus roseus]
MHFAIVFKFILLFLFSLSIFISSFADLLTVPLQGLLDTGTAALAVTIFPRTGKRMPDYTCPDNPLSVKLARGSGDAAEDVIRITFTTCQLTSSPKFPLTCIPTWFAEDLPKRVQGIAGLGRSLATLPTQLAQAFSFTENSPYA